MKNPTFYSDTNIGNRNECPQKYGTSKILRIFWLDFMKKYIIHMAMNQNIAFSRFFSVF